MDIASREGIPVMRPMFVNYPKDEVCYQTGDQYFFGEDILFAPISAQGQTERKVYLPEGKWILTKDKKKYEGNTWVTVSAKIDEFIAFVKEGATVLEAF